jgi:hypothetical protein
VMIPATMVRVANRRVRRRLGLIRGIERPPGAALYASGAGRAGSPDRVSRS